MKNILRIPTDPYAYVEVEFEGTPDEAIAEYQRLYKGLQAVPEGAFQEVLTFTNEVILYDPINHKYKTRAGVPLVSGSAYKKSLEKPFPLNHMAKAVAKKHGVPEKVVREMWQRNSEMSTNLGTALHKALEQYFKHNADGTEKNYHLPKHPFLRNAVLAFPRLHEQGYAEIFVSDVAKQRVGQIDLLLPEKDKTYTVVDYKTDGDIAKNLDGHFNQLSFYGHILTDKGYPVSSLEVWNYTDTWEVYRSPLLDIIQPNA